MSKRHFENWVDGFLQWTRPRSESPDSMLLAVGLFTIACAIRKHVKIPARKILGGWECYPNIYTVLVGEPGVVRKSTTMNFGESLLRKLTNVPAAPTEVSQAALSLALSESPDGSLYIAATELEELVRKTSKEMYGFLTSGYDVRRPIITRTIGRGAEATENPCINMFACTTPGWIKENMPPSVILGGFASRTLFIHEEEARNPNMFFDEDRVNYDEIDKLEPLLIEDLEQMTAIKGEFTISKPLMEWINDEWYKKTLARELKNSDARMRSYYSRKPTHLLKLAMLHKLSRSDELVLNMEDIRWALAFLNMIEPNMMKVFGALGKNTYNVEQDAILDYMRIHKRVPRSELARAFQSSAEPEKLMGLIGFLAIKRVVDVVVVDDEPVYIYKEPTDEPQT